MLTELDARINYKQDTGNLPCWDETGFNLKGEYGNWLEKRVISKLGIDEWNLRLFYKMHTGYEATGISSNIEYLVRDYKFWLENIYCNDNLVNITKKERDSDKMWKSLEFKA